MLDYGRSLVAAAEAAPLSSHERGQAGVILLCAATEKLLVDVPVDDKMEAFKDDLMTFMETEHPEIVLRDRPTPARSPTS